MPDEVIIREKALLAIRNGKLPSRRPDRIWGGPGVNAQCAVCEKIVPRAELELEIQFEQDGGGELDKYHVHIQCFALWELERGQAASQGALLAKL